MIDAEGIDNGKKTFFAENNNKLIMLAESQNTEHKESWRDEYLKWICGFANAQGGRIYIGVNDDRQVVGWMIQRN